MNYTTNDPRCADSIATGGRMHTHYYYTFTGRDRKIRQTLEGAFVTTYLGDFNIANETEILLGAYDTPVITNWLRITCQQAAEYVAMIQRLEEKKAVTGKTHLKALPTPVALFNKAADKKEGGDKDANV